MAAEQQRTLCASVFPSPRFVISKLRLLLCKQLSHPLWDITKIGHFNLIPLYFLWQDGSGERLLQTLPACVRWVSSVIQRGYCVSLPAFSSALEPPEGTMVGVLTMSLIGRVCRPGQPCAVWEARLRQVVLKVRLHQVLLDAVKQKAVHEEL